MFRLEHMCMFNRNSENIWCDNRYFVYESVVLLACYEFFVGFVFSYLMHACNRHELVFIGLN